MGASRFACPEWTGVERVRRIGLAVPAFLFIALTGCAFAQADPYRRLPKLELDVFACAPNPESLVIRNEQELTRALASAARHCAEDLFLEREGAFKRSLGRASIDWDKEALVVAQDWYGTGMATAQLEFDTSTPGLLDVTIRWKVPPPPVTPDTKVFRGAFAVRKSSISTLTISGRDPTKKTLRTRE